MRPSIVKFLEAALLHVTLSDKPVYEFGSYQVEGQEEISNLRPVVKRRYPDLEYVGTDMRDGPGVDRVLDLRKLELEDGSVGTVICLDTLEHVRDPFTALEEIGRVLAPEGGVAILSSVMNFPIHSYPSDYWRFTPEGFRAICEDADAFAEIKVWAAGPKIHPHTVAAVATRGPDVRGELSTLDMLLDFWAERWR